MKAKQISVVQLEELEVALALGRDKRSKWCLNEIAEHT